MEIPAKGAVAEPSPPSVSPCGRAHIHGTASPASAAYITHYASLPQDPFINISLLLPETLASFPKELAAGLGEV